MYLCILATILSIFFQACSFKKESVPTNTAANSTLEAASVIEQSLPESYAKIDYGSTAYSISPVQQKDLNSFATSSFLIFDPTKTSSDLIFTVKIPYNINENISQIDCVAEKNQQQKSLKAKVDEARVGSTTTLRLSIANFKANYPELNPNEQITLNITLSSSLESKPLKLVIVLKTPPPAKELRSMNTETTGRSIDIDSLVQAFEVGHYTLSVDSDTDFVFPVHMNGYVVAHYNTTSYADHVPGQSKPGGDWRTNDCDPAQISFGFMRAKEARFVFLPSDASSDDVLKAMKTDESTQFTTHLSNLKPQNYTLYAIVNKLADPLQDVGTCSEVAKSTVTSCQRTTCNHYQLPTLGCNYLDNTYVCGGVKVDEHDSRYCTSWNFDITGRTDMPEITTLTGYGYTVLPPNALMKSIPNGQSINQGIGGKIQFENNFKGSIKGTVNFSDAIQDRVPSGCDFSI